MNTEIFRNSLYVGCGVVGGELEVLICVGGPMVHFGRERAINIVTSKKWYNMSFSLRSELDTMVDGVEHSMNLVSQYHRKHIIHISLLEYGRDQ